MGFGSEASAKMLCEGEVSDERPQDQDQSLAASQAGYPNNGKANGFRGSSSFLLVSRLTGKLTASRRGKEPLSKALK